MSRVVANDNKRAMEWASSRWPQTASDHDWGPHVTLHLENDLGIRAVVVYNNYIPTNSADIHCAAVDGRWLTRPFLTAVFRYPFEQLKVRRVTARIGANNPKARKFLLHLGFKHEGTIRQGWEPDVDLLVFGLLKNECRFLGEKFLGKAVSPESPGPCSGGQRSNGVQPRDGDLQRCA